jgi:hypothetical protein
MSFLRPSTDSTLHERFRLGFIEGRDGKAAAVAFARRTYDKYRECLLLKRHVLRARGEHDKKPHHATFPEYRRGFIESCLEFRRYLREHK